MMFHITILKYSVIAILIEVGAIRYRKKRIAKTAGINLAQVTNEEISFP